MVAIGYYDMHMSKELPPSRMADQFVARFPDGLRAKLANVAHENGRSMNAELVSRLQASFESGFIGLPFAVMQAVEAEMEDKGLTQEEALVRLVLAGQTSVGTVLNLRVGPGTTAKMVRDALSEALKHIPPDSNLVSTKL